MISISRDCVPGNNGYCKTTTFARDAKTGKLQWQVTHLTYDDIVLATPHQVLLFSSASAYQDIIGLNTQTGSEEWSNEMSSGFSRDFPEYGNGFNALLADGITFTPQLMLIGGYSTIYAFNLDSGKLRWRRALAPVPPPGSGETEKTAANQHGVIFASLQNRLVALNEQSGNIMWQRTVSGLDSGPLFLDDAA